MIMSKESQRNQQILNWLNKEKIKDDIQVDVQKKRYIQEIKKFKKENLFVTEPKLSLWKKIKIMILGH